MKINPTNQVYHRAAGLISMDQEIACYLPIQCMQLFANTRITPCFIINEQETPYGCQNWYQIFRKDPYFFIINPYAAENQDEKWADAPNSLTHP